MEKWIYEIRLACPLPMRIARMQTTFTSAVFKKAEESGILGHGLESSLGKER